MSLLCGRGLSAVLLLVVLFLCVSVWDCVGAVPFTLLFCAVVPSSVCLPAFSCAALKFAAALRNSASRRKNSTAAERPAVDRTRNAPHRTQNNRNRRNNNNNNNNNNSNARTITHTIILTAQHVRRWGCAKREPTRTADLFALLSLFSLPRLLLLFIAAAFFVDAVVAVVVVVSGCFCLCPLGFPLLLLPRTLRQPLGQQPAQRCRGEPSRAEPNPNGADKGPADEERSSMTSNSCRTSGREGATGGVEMEEGTRRCPAVAAAAR